MGSAVVKTEKNFSQPLFNIIIFALTFCDLLTNITTTLKFYCSDNPGDAM